MCITGEAEVNQTLVHMLATEFGVECDPDELLAKAGIEGAIDTPDELEIAFGWLREKAARVPDFSIVEDGSRDFLLREAADGQGSGVSVRRARELMSDRSDRWRSRTRRRLRREGRVRRCPALTDVSCR